MHSLQYSCLAAELGKYSSLFHNISQLHLFYADWPPNAFSAIFESHCRIKQTSLSILQYITTSPPLIQIGYQMHSLQYSSPTAELSKHPSDGPPNAFSAILESYCRISKHPTVFHNFPPLMQMGHQMHSLRNSCLAAELGKYSSVFHNISQLHPSYADWPPNAFSAIFESH